MAKRISPRVNVIIAFALAIGLGLSVTLIVMGSREQGDTGTGGSAESNGTQSGGTGSGGSGATPSSRPPTATLPDHEATAAGIAEMAGLVFPTEMIEFRSAANPNRQQLDLMFSAPPASVSRFLSDSELPSPTEGERLILHGSPLWELNPGENTAISSTEDRSNKIARTVELVTNTADPAANVVVRISLVPVG